MQHALDQEIERLIYKTTYRRQDLGTAALKKTGLRKILHLVAGVMSLLSGTAITAVLTTSFSPFTLEWFAAATAFSSGTIALLTSTFLSERDTATMFKGSARYLALRESVLVLAMNHKMTEAERLTRFTFLTKEYGRLDETYSWFFTAAGQRSYYKFAEYPQNRREWLQDETRKEVELISEEIGLPSILPPEM